MKNELGGLKDDIEIALAVGNIMLICTDCKEQNNEIALVVGNRTLRLHWFPGTAH